MRRIDRQTAESHLMDALQHLSTAGVVVRHLDRNAELLAEDRLRLIRSVAGVQAMLDRVTEALGSQMIDLRILELLRAAEEDEQG